MTHSALLTVPAIIVSVACAPAAGTQPHDMSVADHQAAAAREDDQAQQHDAQHDPAAAQENERCTAGRGTVCWTVSSNPTEEHQHTARRHSELAAQHRAASQALQEAEAKECVGIAEDDRDTSPFARRADIASVSQYMAERQAGKATVSEPAGATIVFRATPGLTAEWLQRIVDCHLARNAAVGHDMPEMDYCPLAPRGAKATVRSVGDGFAVDVQADDKAAAEEIWRRAQQLTQAH